MIDDVIGNFFDDTKARQLFGCRVRESVDDCLTRRIGMFNDVLNNHSSISSIVNRAEEKDCQLDSEDVVKIIQKVHYLKRAYQHVLKKNHEVDFNFRNCCQKSINDLSEFDFTLIKHPAVLMKYNRIFRVYEKLPHPKLHIQLGRKFDSPFLLAFPDAKMMLREWAIDNLSVLTCEIAANYIKTKIVPRIYETYLEDCQSYDNQPTSKEFLLSFGIKSIAITTARRWLSYVGFNFDERKKTYFTDKHESEENIKYREQFIEKYFLYELNAYRWIQLDEEQAMELEKDEKHRLLCHIYYEYEDDNVKKREYHVDSHESLHDMKPTLSVRHNLLSRPLIILGQDESVFKQHSFSHKCWIGPNGETNLLPKNDGCSQMVSGFASRDFGFGLHLSEEELWSVNERRKSNEWSTYCEKEAATEVYGSDKKKMIKDRLTLVRFFDLGVKEEGYWNYFHMALQIEDIFDVLSIKFPDHDFLILMDQSSGHGKSLSNGLNAAKMNVSYGGTQPAMRKTTIKEVGPYHSQLNIGDEQCMLFQNDDVGPFFLDDNGKLKKKFDEQTEETKIIKKKTKNVVRRHQENWIPG